jgi:hypothetical protein
MRSPRYPTRTPSVCAENDHPDPGGHHPSSWRNHVSRRAFLLVPGALLGVSGGHPLPSFSAHFLDTTFKRCFSPCEGIRILMPEAGVGPGKRNRGWVWVPSFPLPPATGASRKRTLPGHPPRVVQNHIPVTQIHSPENFRKI